MILDPENDALEVAGAILRVRLGEIFDLREAVIRADDIEAVHDMRVITRRMRSALRDLRKLIETEPLAALSGNLKSLADLLGEARDNDVAIVGLRQFQSHSREAVVRDGIGELIAERSEHRSAVQPKLIAAVSEVELTHILESFNDVFFDPIKRRPGSEISFAEAGRRAVGRAIEEFIDLSDSLSKPSEAERLHQLRIAAKRLRYAIEFFGGCWGRKLKPFAKQVAAMQTLLGDVHDADVWITNLDSRPHDRANRWLIAEFFKRRSQNHRDAFELWSDWRESGLIKKLRRLIDG